MKFLAAFLLFAAFGLAGCETQRTETVNDGFGMEFTESSDADQAKVID
ncbi:hypothetical protein [Cerasicoccus fimbriatus]|nr:hypothetical protein [Cerasicoccus sp. TK19100]